jgi:eukaryotic-like serine/threonine-protein kinase
MSLYALDPQTGALYWKFTTDSAIFSTPVIVDNTLYFTSYGSSSVVGRLYSLTLPANLSVIATPIPVTPTPVITATSTPLPVNTTTSTPMPSASPMSPLTGFVALAVAGIAAVVLSQNKK